MALSGFRDWLAVLSVDLTKTIPKNHLARYSINYVVSLPENNGSRLNSNQSFNLSHLEKDV